jgi:hypothetical protein
MAVCRVFGCLALATFAWWGFVQQIILGQPFGSNPGPDWVVWLTLLLVGIGLPALLVSIRLIVTVERDGVTIRYRPFTTRCIGFEEVESYQARAYKPIKEYAGWGDQGLVGGAYVLRCERQQGGRADAH